MEKWSLKPSIGRPVWPSRFVPMKMPLTDALIVEHFPPPSVCPNPFTVTRLLDHFHQAGLHLGMILSLANDCLYGDDVPCGLPIMQARRTCVPPPFPAHKPH